MSLEANKAVVRRFYEQAVVSGNLDLLDDLVAEDVDDWHAPRAGWLPGRAGFKQHVADIHRALADLRITVDDLIAEGDRVVAFWTGYGTSRDTFMGFASTGQPVTWTVVSVLRLTDGQITYYRARPDKFTLMQRFSLVLVPPAPVTG